MNCPKYVNIYLNRELRAHIERLMDETGLSQGQILTRLLKETLPKAKMKTHTYTVHELTFE